VLLWTTSMPSVAARAQLGRWPLPPQADRAFFLAQIVLGSLIQQVGGVLPYDTPVRIQRFLGFGAGYPINGLRI